MEKAEAIVLIFILIVALAGVWFLFKGPGRATEQEVYRTYEAPVPVVERACVCRDTVNEQEKLIPIGKAGSVYDCRNMCNANGWEFVELRQ